jgi:DNA helicase-2/ATP-dependent DNA helicase PcrA
LDAAHKIITKNQNRTEKELWTSKKGGKEIEILAARNERHEAEKVANTIFSQVSLRLRDFSDFAVLYRTNAQSRAVEEVFLQNQIPYKIVGGVRFYDRAEIKDLIAYLRLIYQPDDLASLQRIVNVPKRGIGPASLEKLLAARGERDLITTLTSTENDARFTPKVRASLTKLGRKLQQLRKEIDITPVDELIQKIIKTFAYEEYLNDGTVAGEARIENVQELLTVAKNYAGLLLEDFLAEVALVSGSDETTDGNAVTLMTIHAAKGLEFPVVVLIGLEESVFPPARAFYEPTEMEEERRLAYVALTRAMEELYLSYAQQRMLFGQFASNPVSRFIEDLGLTASASQEDELAPVQNDIWLDDEPRFVPDDDLELQVGDHVQHRSFGVGQITALDGATVTVNFHGKVRKLNVAFAPLTKVS